MADPEWSNHHTPHTPDIGPPPPTRIFNGFLRFFSTRTTPSISTRTPATDPEWQQPHSLISTAFVPQTTSRPTSPVQPFIDRLRHFGLLDLFSPGDATHDTIINLATLQRMSLSTIQRELVQEVAKIRTGSNASLTVGVRRLMKDYGTVHDGENLLFTDPAPVSALRDWETILEYSAKAKNSLRLDPFVLTSARSLELGMMLEANLVTSTHTKVEDCRDFKDPILPGGSRRHLNRTRKMENFWERFYMAAFGGIALVGPMLIMVLHRGKATSLVTVSVSVLLFAIIISKYSTGTPEAVLGIVAAYAAVLVVFVGTSS
jgi:hypothetical protein